MLTFIFFEIIAAGIPYLILREKTGTKRIIAAYLAGFIAAFGISVAAFVFLEWGSRVGPTHDQLLGLGLVFGLFGPLFGIIAAHRSRAKVPPIIASDLEAMNSPTVETNLRTAGSTTPPDRGPTLTESYSDPYQQAGEELLNGNLNPAIWARSLVEGAGNESAVKAAYVRMRVAQLDAEPKAKAEEEQSKIAHKLSAYAALNKTSLDEAKIMLPWKIYKVGSRYAFYGDQGEAYEYEKLEDAVADAKRFRF